MPKSNRGVPNVSSRSATPFGPLSAMLSVYCSEYGPFVERCDELLALQQELQLFDQWKEQGYRYPGVAYADPKSEPRFPPKNPRQIRRAELAARVEAAKEAVVGQVAKLVAVLRRVADAARGCRGRDFLWIASQLDDAAATVEKHSATSGSARWQLDRIESRELPKLREELAKAEFNAVSVAKDEEPLSRLAAGVWEILLELPTDPPTGMTGPKLVRELKKRGVSTSEPTFRSYAVPELKKRGMKNKPKVGYYLPKSARKES